MSEDSKTSSKLDTVKTVARYVVGFSVGSVTIAAISQNVATETKSQKLQLIVGTFVIGSMVADKARDYTDQRIDNIVAAVRSAKDSASEVTNVN